MKMRILVFEDEFAIRKPLCNFLRAKGHEVLDFPSPISCALVADKNYACPRDHACADLLITDMNMPGMTGLELIRVMAENGCHLPAENKIIISSALTAEQQAELRSYGCHFLPKPFQLENLWQLIQLCEQNVPRDRQLAPVEELWQTIRKQP